MNELIIDINNVTKIYDQMTDYPVKSLINVSLQVKKGEFIAVMGPSGSGKTTLINCLSTMDTPTEGQIYLYGKSVLELSDKDIGKFRSCEIGFIFQDYQLLDYLTLEENIAFPLSMNNISIKKIKKSIRSVATDLGIETILDKYPDECSGGEKQRVAIARALVSNPSIIVADEPTGNLDSKNTYELMHIFKNLNEKAGKTIVLVTHDVMVASYSSRLLYIQDGKIKDQIRREDFGSQEEYFLKISQINSQERLSILSH